MQEETPQQKKEYRWIGKPVRRSEDRRFITGHGHFLSNLRFPDASHVAILRSPFAHAEIRNVDVSRALRQPGVRAVLTGGEVKDMMKPWPHLIRIPDCYGIAVDKARYVGEPVAILAASDEFTAQDALELIDVEYEPLPVVTQIEKATEESAPLVHEDFERNIAWHKNFVYGDIDRAFRDADMTVSEKYYFHRYSSTPLDLTSCVASYDQATEELTIWDQNQLSPMYHTRYSKVLNVPSNRLRIINPDIGGGFGNKVHVYPYSALIALMAMKLGGSVRWVADRQGDMSAVMHQPDRVTSVEAAVKSDGTILGLKLVIRENFGAYVRHPEPQNVTRAFPSLLGCYKIGAVSIDAYGVFTNTCPTGPNRGYGQQHACFALERTVDAIARKLGVTPEGVRFTNFVPPESMPYETPLGSVYDGGNYPLALKKAMELIESEKVRARQKEMREKGIVVGLGLACTVEGGGTAMGFARLWGLEEKHAAGYGSPAESAHVKMLPDGKAVVAMGTVPQGQGHETVAAQIVAEQLGIQPGDVTVLPGFDSLTHPYSGAGSGTYGCRFSQLGVGALLGASGKIQEKMLLIAAHRLKAKPSELQVGDGRIHLRDKPDVGVSVRQIARIAHNMLAFLPPGLEPGLEAVHTYAFPYSQPVGNDMRGNLCCSYGNLAGAATVQIDIETGNVRVNKLVIVHDNGRILNPLIVEGQMLGGAAHGLAGSLYEHFVYNDDGQLLTSTFVDYLAITSVEMPEVTLSHMETPSPFTPLGAKGCGEGSAILLPALIGNAVEDALSPFGVRITELPLTPNKIWELLRQSEKKS